MKKIILIGGGAQCRVVLEAIRSRNALRVAGIIDENPALKEVNGYRVIGSDRDLNDMYRAGIRQAFITVGSVGEPRIRVTLAARLITIGFTCPVISHASAVIASSARIGAGSFIGPGAVVGPDVKTGRHCIINTNASVDHDCRIGDFVHIAPGATLSGGVTVGNKTHIGTGACIIEYKKIGNASIIGAGSCVVSNIPSACTAYGNPCAIVKK
jgi:UDP-perosamine 4-acetyltransferase